MDLLVFGLFLIFGGLALKYLGQQIATTQVNKICLPHKWRYWDSKGWLQEPYPDDRLEHARLRCQNCLTYPNEQKKEIDYE